MNTNKKGFASIVLILVVVLIAGVGWYFAMNDNSSSNMITDSQVSKVDNSQTPTQNQAPKQLTTPKPPVSLLKACPEQWYVDRMPSVGSSDVSKEYFIYKGSRRELIEFDVEWVKSNCSVKPSYVY